MTHQSLPIDSLYQAFQSSYKKHHLVVESDTGSGKSTRLPLWCVKANEQGNVGRVLVVEPRRVACLALANFVQRQTDIKVGYAIRFDSTIDAQTQIAFVTPGIALRWLAASEAQLGPLAGLACFSTVIIDEFHERRWDTDLLLAMLKTYAQHRLILTSATIEGSRLVDYLSDKEGEKALGLRCEGKRFHVELRYFAGESHHLPDIRGLELRVKSALEPLINETSGDILVFLPGKGEINTCIQACQNMEKVQQGKLELGALHGAISAPAQAALLSEPEHQRVIFATNIAETSLTIPGVSAVIDSGLERRTHQRNGRTVLSLARISKASSEQRMGRAGRTQAGICIRLWGKGAPLESKTPAELLREELIEPMLAAASAGYSLDTLDFIDTLHPKSLALAKDKLVLMGAIDEEGRITEHGRRLFPLPIDSQFAHLISAMPNDECRDLMIDLAAMLTTPGRFYRLPTDEYDRQRLAQWDLFGCDAYLLIKLLRHHDDEIPLLDINRQALNEAGLLSAQIREALGFTSRVKADLSCASLRQAWLVVVMSALPELAFIRRQRRQQALGNGFSEVLIGRDSRFESCDKHKPVHQAAVVFDQHITAGKGVKQTLNLATCMAPASLSTMLAAGLGEDRQVEQIGVDRVMVERVYAGRTIHRREEQIKAQNILEAITTAICADQLFEGVSKRLTADIEAWNVWLTLGFYDEVASSGVALPKKRPLNVRDFLHERLLTLGVGAIEDLQLIDAEDLGFSGIPDWLRQDFDQAYPLQLELADLKLAVTYQVKRKLVMLDYLSGLRKSGPKRWELPRWQGWKLQYRKASRVVDIL